MRYVPAGKYSTAPVATPSNAFWIAAVSSFTPSPTAAGVMSVFTLTQSDRSVQFSSGMFGPAAAAATHTPQPRRH